MNSVKVPKIKKILLFEMKFLVPNYSCLQNPWLGGLAPRSPSSLSSVLNWIWLTPPEKNSWVRHCFKSNLKSNYFQTHVYSNFSVCFGVKYHLFIFPVDLRYTLYIFNIFKDNFFYLTYWMKSPKIPFRWLLFACWLKSNFASFQAFAAKQISTIPRCVIAQKNSFLRNEVCLYKLV